jgi:2'-5' RNA ligase
MRLFFAIKIKENEELIKMLNIAKNLFKVNRIKWVLDEQLHITVFFIGEVDNNLSNQLIYDSKIVFSSIKSFQLEFDNNLIFYHKNIPKVIGVSFKPNAEIIDIKNKTEKLLEKYNIFPENRAFVPHITFGRVKEFVSEKEFYKFINTNFIEIVKKTTYNFESYVLYKSTLTPDGPIYDEIWKITI